MQALDSFFDHSSVGDAGTRNLVKVVIKIDSKLENRQMCLHCQSREICENGFVDEKQCLDGSLFESNDDEEEE